MKISFLAKNALHFSILILLFILIYPYTFDQKLFIGGDNANYFILAKSLASGNGYTNLNSYFPSQNNHYPPGYPFLMSLFMRVGIDSLHALKTLNGILFLFSTMMTYQLVMKLTEGKKIAALSISILLMLNANLLEYSSITMSEILFLTLLLLSIHLFLLFKEKDFSLKSIYFYLFIASLVFLIYTRSQGYVVLIATFIYLMLHKKWLISTLFVSLVLLALLPWQIRSHNLGGNSYMKQLLKVNPYEANSPNMERHDWSNRIVKNLERYTSKEIPKLIFPSMQIVYKDISTGKDTKSPILHWLIGIGIMGITAIGIFGFKRYEILFLLLFSGSFAILMLWPEVWYGTRFILPMTPLILIFLIQGGITIIKFLFSFKKFEFLNSQYLYAPLFLLGIFSIDSIKFLHLKAELNHSKNYENYFELATWTKDNLPENTVIVTRKPELFYCKSLKKTVGFPYSTNPEDFYSFFKTNKVTHVVIEQLGYSQTGKFLIPIIQKSGDKFKQVKSIDSDKIIGQNGKGEKTETNNPNGVWMFEYLPDKGYEGKYINGLKYGKGIYKYQNGNVFTGEWKNDTISGYGKFTIANGDILEGTWENDKKEGKFLYFKNKQWYECYYRQDKIVKDGFLLDNNRKRIGSIKFN